MSRNYTIKIARLPVLNSSETSVLGTQLASTCESVEAELAEEKKLPDDIIGAKEKIKTSGEELDLLLAPAEPSEGTKAQKADVNNDKAWRASHDWHESILNLPPSKVPEYDLLQSLWNILYADGLAFTQLAYRDEWFACESRLKTIEQGGYEAAIVAQGGGVQLEVLKEAHAAYGEALGISAEMEAVEDSRLGEARRIAQDDMRRYIGRVIFWPDDESSKEHEIAMRLLRPVMEWEDKKSVSDNEPSEEPDETTPDETTPDETTPDETTPDETTPDETTPDEETGTD